MIDIASVTFPRLSVLLLIAPRHYPRRPTLDLFRARVILRILLFVVSGHYLLTVEFILLEGYIETWRRTELVLIFYSFLFAEV